MAFIHDFMVSNMSVPFWWYRDHSCSGLRIPTLTWSLSVTGRVCWQSRETVFLGSICLIKLDPVLTRRTLWRRYSWLPGRGRVAWEAKLTELVQVLSKAVQINAHHEKRTLQIKQIACRAVRWTNREKRRRGENVYCSTRANCRRAEKYQGIEWKSHCPLSCLEFSTLKSFDDFPNVSSLNALLLQRKETVRTEVLRR